MKKMITLLCAITLVVGTLTACGAAKTNTAEKTTEVTKEATTTEAATDTKEAAATTEQKQLVVGFDASFPPYGYKDESGEYVGFDLDLAQEVCDRLGWTLVKQPIDWDSKDMELSAGTIDCIWNGFTYNGREKEYTWSTPYVDNSQVFVVAKDAGIASPADLAGKVVDVQTDSSALAALNDEANADLKNSFTELVTVPEYNTAFMNLESGAADAVAMDIGVAQYQIASRDSKFVILDDELATEVYAVGFLLGNETLRDTVQEQLDAMKADGTFLEIATKWKLEKSVIIEK